MEKTLEELTKTIGGHGQVLQKTAAFYKAAGDAHAELATAHQGHADFVKAKHEAMDDGDAHKTYFGKVAAMHTAKVAHHKAMSDLCKAHSDLGDAAKVIVSLPADPAAAGAAGGEPGGIQTMIGKTTDALVAKALESLNTDPKVAEAIQKMVLDQVNAALATKIVPDGVKAVIPGAPKLVPRAGAEPPKPIDTKGIAPEFQHLAEA